VSLALGRLQARGSVIRAGRNQWLLRGEPPELLASLAAQAGLQA
jgi:hypothetical protein